MSRQPPFADRRQRGYLLLAVLVFLFLASVMVVAVLESATRNIRSAAVAAARDDLRLTAFSAMEVALATLAEIKELDNELNSPKQGWGAPLSYSPVAWPEGMQVSVEIIDETGKLPLESLDREVMQQFMEQLGVDMTESDKLIDAYLDWTDEDDLERLNGAEADYYERQTPSRLPPNGPITSYEAFRYIKGFDELFFEENGAPNALFKAFKQSTSLKHSHPVNFNTTSPAVRSMLAEYYGVNLGQLEDFENGPDGIPGTEDDPWYPPKDGGPAVDLPEYFGYEAHVFRIVVRVEQGEKRFQLTALVDDGSSSTTGNGNNSENTNSGNTGGNGGNGGAGGNFGGGGNGGGRPGMGGGVVVDRPQAGDGESDEGQSGGDDADTAVLYTSGDFRFLELTENGPKDD